MVSKPNTDALRRALELGGSPYGALPWLAAHHLALPPGTPARLRTTSLSTERPHLFPAPRYLEGLLGVLFNRLQVLFPICRSVDDDLHVAAFALWGVLAIHPFDNANGRTAVDFVQLLLMSRLSSTTPLLALPQNAQQQLGPALVAFEQLGMTNPDPAVAVAHLQARLQTTRFEALPGSPLGAVARAFHAVLLLEKP